MMLTDKLRLRIYCKRRKGDAVCGGIYETSPKELSQAMKTAKCPRCDREFSEGRTFGSNGELLKTFGKLPTVAANWPFDIELIDTP